MSYIIEELIDGKWLHYDGPTWYDGVEEVPLDRERADWLVREYEYPGQVLRVREVE